MWAQREATKINVALGRAGMDDASTTDWWNHRAYEDLGGRTPLQAWQRQEYRQVKALVECLLSQRFADQLWDSPQVVSRFEQSKNS